jgi:very-short-patch-repair endonuclease
VSVLREIVNDVDFLDSLANALPQTPIKVTHRTMRDAVEAALMNYTREDLERILPDELGLVLEPGLSPPGDYENKRQLIRAFTTDWKLPALARLARRVVTELDDDTRLIQLLGAYQESGGVTGAVKNLIFAANGPKPELLLRDAISNDIEITENSEYCLVFDREIPADGLSFQALIAWWRDREQLEGRDDRTVGLALHQRLESSLAGNEVERQLFNVYGNRYRTYGFGIPVLVPQVYLHYDPYTAKHRGAAGSPLRRQRMDFLLLFSDRRRVVIEVDGRQHYADSDGHANTASYAAMVAEDRRLQLAGYEVYRFGGKELDASPMSSKMLQQFFDALSARSA